MRGQKELLQKSKRDGAFPTLNLALSLRVPIKGSLMLSQTRPIKTTIPTTLRGKPTTLPRKKPQ